MIHITISDAGPYDEPAAPAADRMDWIDGVLADGGAVRCFSSAPLLRVRRRIVEGAVSCASVQVDYNGQAVEVDELGDVSIFIEDDEYNEYTALRRTRARVIAGREALKMDAGSDPPCDGGVNR